MSVPLVDLTGKVAVVTGGSVGQGAAECRLFAELGARVVAADVHDEPGLALAAELGDGVVFEHLDIRDPAAWARVVEVTVARFGRIDVLVNNAGILRRSTVQEVTLEDLELVIGVNLFGTILGMQAVSKPMGDAGGGSIVNVASTAGLSGYPNGIAYGSSKWGIRGATRAAAKDLGPLGIRVNCICPGSIDTDMASPASREGVGVIATLPIPRIGRPPEVASLAAFLASDASSYSTGADFIIDGGMTA